MAEMGIVLKTGSVDIVCLSLIDSPELKYLIIKDGKLILEKEPYRIILELRIMS